MKKLLIAAALLCTVSVQAQEMKAKTPEQRAAQRTKMMERKLKLNEDQTAQIQRINAETATKIEAPMARNRADRAQIQALKASQEAEYKRVLSAEQYTTYEAAMAERKAKMKNRSVNMRRVSDANSDQNQPQRMQSMPAEVR